MQALLQLNVPDADKTFEQAVNAGAEPVTKVTALPSGERVGRVRDPFGNIWWIQSHVEDVSREKLEQRIKDPCQQEAMRYVEQSLEWELGKNVQQASQHVSL
jgi:UTP-glucose-1-phosphate uridylyltransferase